MDDNYNSNDLLTTTQAAKVLSVAPDTVLKWVKAGKIKAHRTLGGHFRIPLSELRGSAIANDDSAAQPLDKSQDGDFLYCWEYLAGGGNVKAECRDCITFRSRSRRCYELRDLPGGVGCLQMCCQSTCEECNYYRLVIGQGINILIYSDRPQSLRHLTELEEDEMIHIKIIGDDYRCSQLIENFRPDYIIVDCSIGKRRTSHVCRNFFDDPRIPVARIILASKNMQLEDYCDKEVFGWIKKPFTVTQLRECLQIREKIK